MEQEWENVHFSLIPYKDTGVSILSAIDDVQVLMDDHIVKTTTMKNSPFIKPFEKEVNEWDHRLVKNFINNRIYNIQYIYISKFKLSKYFSASNESHP